MEETFTLSDVILLVSKPKFADRPAFSYEQIQTVFSKQAREPTGFIPGFTKKITKSPIF